MSRHNEVQDLTACFSAYVTEVCQNVASLQSSYYLTHYIDFALYHTMTYL